MIKQHIRPIPYYSLPVTEQERVLAALLRKEFIAKLGRRLQAHHLLGFSHDFIINFIRKNKKDYPFFLCTDISRFYPSIQHTELLVNTQIAYKELLTLPYVPRGFKTRYLGAIRDWLAGLPSPVGLPIGSPLSAILAPVMLLPLWLSIKKYFGVPFIVFMDDVIFCCKNREESAEIYTYIQNELTINYNLTLNVQKTMSGRFSTDRVRFCGWEFTGGYSRISATKLTRFKERISDLQKRCKGVPPRQFMKRLNRKIDGFGNYYKHGDVGKQFETLDAFLRSTVRAWFKHYSDTKLHTNQELSRAGLHSLSLIYHRLHDRKGVKQELKRVKQPTPPLTYRTHQTGSSLERSHYLLLIETLESINNKLTDVVHVQRKMYQLLDTLLPG